LFHLINVFDFHKHVQFILLFVLRLRFQHTFFT
jgi:hypothetical protein